MKVLDVPTVSITELKKDPAKVAKMAADMGIGVYVLNRGKAISVTLTPEQYAALVADQERLLDLEVERQAIENIKNDSGERIPAEKVIGHPIGDTIDPDDGWE
ncbi:type II toxin-antitoxin system Phd/YefM family antitoxin [Schleiferilactobacillus shenzhenensis]|uniref:Antitoxin n=1 Tax=Schleiferilactobacillus shenzhenensis LY-73 TaxID=1231336 RepID=U4TP19_9LACO|nr:type II toxin-antitoxin system Phd/YefM family antitoxin [Schleiferilactobacillus shenzhenensis]ERL65959.1 hypothetical protein L248_2035 [Schleiferilactobacillus shenzhenensis LY-73]